MLWTEHELKLVCIEMRSDLTSDRMTVITPCLLLPWRLYNQVSLMLLYLCGWWLPYERGQVYVISILLRAWFNIILFPLTLILTKLSYIPCCLFSSLTLLRPKFQNRLEIGGTNAVVGTPYLGFERAQEF